MQGVDEAGIVGYNLVMRISYAKQLRVYARRRDKIIALHRQGWTYERIAAKFGIRRQRVGQIIKANGMARQ